MPLPDLDGNNVVPGSWIAEGRSAGLGVREFLGLAGEFCAWFVPHMVDTPEPSETERARRLEED